MISEKEPSLEETKITNIIFGENQTYITKENSVIGGDYELLYGKYNTLELI